jgi:hypothetical protein
MLRIIPEERSSDENMFSRSLSVPPQIFFLWFLVSSQGVGHLKTIDQFRKSRSSAARKTSDAVTNGRLRI